MVFSSFPPRPVLISSISIPYRPLLLAFLSEAKNRLFSHPTFLSSRHPFFSPSSDFTISQSTAIFPDKPTKKRRSRENTLARPQTTKNQAPEVSTLHPQPIRPEFPSGLALCFGRIRMFFIFYVANGSAFFSFPVVSFQWRLLVFPHSRCRSR